MTQVEPSGTMIVFCARGDDIHDGEAVGPATERERDYFRERARHERAAAEKAASDAVRSVHQALAQRYAALSGASADSS